MGARPADPRRIKLHRSYSIAEAADTLGVHKHTVENWLRQGLRPIDRRRPILIHGTELRLFLQERRRRRKSPCRPDEFYCLKCRTPRQPDGGLVDYLPKTPSTGNLRGLCPECGSLMHRCITKAQLTSLAQHFDIAFPQEQTRLNDCSLPAPICAFGEERNDRPMQL